MKILADFLGIIIFFVAFKLYGIYIAIIAAIAVTALQVLISLIRYRKVDKMLLFTFAAIVILGGSSLVFHNEMFIKWKPTVLNIIFAMVFWGSHFFGEKPIVHKMLNSQFDIPDKIWDRLSYAWIAFFLFMAVANLYVAYHFSTDAWVNFKLFGVLGLTFLFAIIQGLFLVKHHRPDTKDE